MEWVKDGSIKNLGLVGRIDRSVDRWTKDSRTEIICSVY
jgi:hypothetical protein